ncbi:hypothetical protein ILYODFUR_030288 [Ilyodon furcidens]|uniref:Uncharacterized protein n=1 Tax=Ilyodon furcidens TaxID=33524 RepID=A0ABV0T1X7_9TELE
MIRFGLRRLIHDTSPPCVFLSIHPDLRWSHEGKRSRNLSLSDTVQLILRDPKLIPGQNGNIDPPAGFECGPEVRTVLVHAERHDLMTPTEPLCLILLHWQAALDYCHRLKNLNVSR